MKLISFVMKIFSLADFGMSCKYTGIQICKLWSANFVSFSTDNWHWILHWVLKLNLILDYKTKQVLCIVLKITDA